jgi:signal transduction histidine kinase
VTDTGIGIPSDKINLVFEPFVQLGSDRTTVGQGTGLGLAISRELARSMNGELSATSEPGAGSAFTLSLPAANPTRT